MTLKSYKNKTMNSKFEVRFNISIGNYNSIKQEKLVSIIDVVTVLIWFSHENITIYLAVDQLLDPPSKIGIMQFYRIPKLKFLYMLSPAFSTFLKPYHLTC